MSAIKLIIATESSCTDYLSELITKEEDTGLNFEEIRSLPALLGLGVDFYFRRVLQNIFFLPVTVTLMILLCRMSSPGSLRGLSLLVGRAESTISVIFNYIIEKPFGKFYSDLKFDYQQFRTENLVRFGKAINKLCSKKHRPKNVLDSYAKLLTRFTGQTLIKKPSSVKHSNIQILRLIQAFLSNLGEYLSLAFEYSILYVDYSEILIWVYSW
ncbi:hypothetical protein PHYBLDRAFT_62049 [Phycomyces blakesleeanus NRRL 1555(-)]|uniref:Uncharacterized protein n=1 Tax=Phycomyces blakesleeanus (strain ATCC 8743b / DSM 1359 / FGSC 10004 / NBRC 33097 / NRRL 1555) TaxID=763407 RepID=A0A167R734_PHYB8|nr:hypothetical protein PHYBLDRAFT_62049 [Phycomyces blakesleeanus NRRL 1555(-)]OAD81007.1 hypothetical protein PHYBLDRAFT_62049 [Phycomyces blakesleeanus NRRL 1555(-)]|eukprot:XP_018299047.1 hypothetical protein PHYBLDRAFT_62049 [Phycomyces blakesleeanus NRRL 1555(-)]